MMNNEAFCLYIYDVVVFSPNTSSNLANKLYKNINLDKSKILFLILIFGILFYNYDENSNTFCILFYFAVEGENIDTR